jgi:hypothetical protein
MLKVDHFTPLSRAVASIDRDAYAARFAIYDRAHKALLQRLATADSPVSDADIAGEEQAFRDAIRRIEFADENDQPTLVPHDGPSKAVPPEPRLDSAWPQLGAPRHETLDASNLPSLDHIEPGIAVESIIQLSEPRSVARRVGGRLALAVVALALAGVGLWMVEARRDGATDPSLLRGAVQSTEPAVSDNAADAKALPPAWLSPQIFYVPPAVPASSPRPASSPAPRADVPLPMPRPER